MSPLLSALARSGRPLVGSSLFMASLLGALACGSEGSGAGPAGLSGSSGQAGAGGDVNPGGQGGSVSGSSGYNEGYPPATSPSSSPPAWVVSGCQGLQQAYSGWMQRCGRGVPDPATQGPLVDRCAGLASLQGVGVTAEGFAHCQAQIGATPCDRGLPLDCLRVSEGSELGPGFWTGDTFRGVYDLMPRAPGSLAQGQRCDVDYQCQTGLFCTSYDGGAWVDGGGACGVCAVLRDLGESCDDDEVCGRGRCLQGVCAETGAVVGEACQLGPKQESGCQPSLFCDAPAPPGKGVCRARQTIGAPCSGALLCDAAGVCVDGVCQRWTQGQLDEACDATTRCPYDTTCQGVCAQEFTGFCWGEGCPGPGGPGAACDPYNNCQADLICGRDPECLPGELCSTGRCQPPPPVGGACYLGRCEGAAYCDSSPGGTCRAPNVAGDACDAQHPCLPSLACRRGACVALDACSRP